MVVVTNTFKFKEPLQVCKGFFLVVNGIRFKIKINK